MVCVSHLFPDRVETPLSINVAKWTSLFSFCASLLTSFLLLTLLSWSAEIVSSFLHSLYKAALVTCELEVTVTLFLQSVAAPIDVSSVCLAFRMVSLYSFKINDENFSFNLRTLSRLGFSFANSSFIFSHRIYKPLSMLLAHMI